MKILLIEDDKRLTRLVKQVLEEQGWVVDVADNGATGLEWALEGLYDVAIIDWMLPERDGTSICRVLRAAHSQTALLLLTARSQVEDRVDGLDSGADDYLTKPFAFAELLARVRALARRHQTDQIDSQEIRCGEIILNLRTHTARRANRTLDLTSTEWSLLECLLRHPNQVLSRQQLVNYVWSNERDVQLSIVEVYISYLRNKLVQPGKQDPIQTVRGVGYRLESAYA
jgi:DNA-binding response OmpR family regulator